MLSRITRARTSGAIEPARAARYRNAYLQAERTVSHLSGTRRTELSAVLANATQMAADGALNPSRMPSVFLTVERNRQWWTTGSLLSYGSRVTFPGSRLLWEYYPGQGIELQWLGTFGEANGYFLSGQHEALKQVLQEAAALAVNRAGGIAWDYLFHFDGGAPPWTSGLSQGTAIQAYARASSALHEAAFASIAQRALGVFQTPPPTGVRMQIAPAGAGQPARVHYLEYSFAPRERILNGFIQSLNGLYDYAQLTGSTLGQRLFEEGDAEARVEVRRYNTGAWSMYDQHSESDLGYHELLAEFLQDLCNRTRQGPPTPPITAATGGTGAQQDEGKAQGEGAAPGGGGQAPSESQPPHQKSQPIGGDQIYCETASEFDEDVHTPPTISLLSKTLPAGARAGVQFSLSKISSVSLTISTMKGQAVAHNSATVEGGKPRLLWDTPRGSGIYRVSATAVDLAGNRASTSGTIRVVAHKRGSPVSSN